jgi:hypothetical protein
VNRSSRKPNPARSQPPSTRRSAPPGREPANVLVLFSTRLVEERGAARIFSLFRGFLGDPPARSDPQNHQAGSTKGSGCVFLPRTLMARSSCVTSIHAVSPSRWTRRTCGTMAEVQRQTVRPSELNATCVRRSEIGRHRPQCRRSLRPTRAREQAASNWPMRATCAAFTGSTAERAPLPRQVSALAARDQDVAPEEEGLRARIV